MSESSADKTGVAAQTAPEVGSNRLRHERSPYLKQHANNPVDWYPWGEEALTRSRDTDKPILLSIGYSACHWCHVMERECFEDSAIAAQMNEHFVNIKVDREERPDLDQIYQLVVQMMGRSGGWPLTVFLTPDRKPFFGGTYFPPVDRQGMPGFPTVLQAVTHNYRQRRAEIETSATRLTRSIERFAAPSRSRGELSQELLHKAVRQLERNFDLHHGGFGSQPKFPQTMGLELLLRAHVRGMGPRALEHLQLTLERMRAGGIYDQLGGGFHRYAVDERWLVPHFEKMLYDNALLLRLYLDAYRVTGKASWAETVREVARYVQREMRAPEGGLFCTQDADSDGEEGTFFVWTPAQLRELLQPADSEAAELYFGVTEAGNFEHGTTVLHQNRSLETVAKQLDRDPEEVARSLQRAREVLFRAREARPKPFRDEKVLSSWNGLMLGALAEAGGALDEPAWLTSAQAALTFCRQSMQRDGVLLRSAKDGDAHIEAFLDDYANLANGALDVYENTFDPAALGFAKELVHAALDRFWDWDHNCFWYTPSGATDLIARCQDVFDSAVPSATSSMCRALLRLHALGGPERLAEHLEQVLTRLAPRACDNPLGYGNLLCVLDDYLYGPSQIVLCGARDDPALQALARAVRASHVPCRALLLRASDATAAELGSLPEVASSLEPQRGRATAYVCRQRSCGPPVHDPDALRALLVRQA